jgi:GT2 family glycosyltransferase
MEALHGWSSMHPIQSPTTLQSSKPGRIGVATVLFNSESVLPDFLKSLNEQSYRNFTVYAVDNASKDQSKAICSASCINIRVTSNEENLGFAVATNQGIRQAIADGCEYILLLNNDVAFSPEFFSELVQGLVRNRADLVAPLTYYFDTPTLIWAAGGRLHRPLGNRPVHLGMGQQDRGQFGRDQKIEFAPGSAILAWRNVFDRIGFLDEAYFTYWEDTDFAVRALRAGLKMYLIPTAKLWHKVSSLAGIGSPFQRYYSVRNHALYIQKHCNAFHSAVLSFVYLTFYRIAAFLRKGDGSRAQHWKEGIRLAKQLNNGCARS